MNHLVWRQSGLDAHSHAYPAEGGFIPTGVSYAPELGEVEYRVPICGYPHPAAFVMPHGAGAPCDTCKNLVEPSPISSVPSRCQRPPHLESFTPQAAEIRG